MELKLYQVDAFADQVFRGNPAAVCPLDDWLDDAVMQAIAAENNLSETAFFVPHGDGFQLRWFTPTTEVDLCGHATLATAFVLFREFGYGEDIVRFSTRSGTLQVAARGGKFVMDFPSQSSQPCVMPAGLAEALGKAPVHVRAGQDYIAVFERESDIRDLAPDLNSLMTLPLRCVVVTAVGDHVDFVSRCFGPKLGIPEDPVTGSTHCALAPYWAERLGKNILQARQLSKRGGEIECRVDGPRVHLAGNAVKYLAGTITVPPGTHSGS